MTTNSICESCKGRGTLGGSFYVWESCRECGGTGEAKDARRCDHCGRGMNEGYLCEEAPLTLCSTECADDIFGTKAFNEMLDTGELFWTTWGDEE